jgi:hypothetical protein
VNNGPAPGGALHGGGIVVSRITFNLIFSIQKFRYR